MENVDFKKNSVPVDTGIENSMVSWTVGEDIARNNPDETSSNWQDVKVWEGVTHTPKIRFEMFAVRENLYCLNTYNVVTWGPEEEYMLELNDYTYVDNLEDGYETAEQVYDSIMRGVR